MKFFFRTICEISEKIAKTFIKLYAKSVRFLKVRGIAVAASEQNQTGKLSWIKPEVSGGVSDMRVVLGNPWSSMIQEGYILSHWHFGRHSRQTYLDNIKRSESPR